MRPVIAKAVEGYQFEEKRGALLPKRLMRAFLWGYGHRKNMYRRKKRARLKAKYPEDRIRY